MITMATSVQSVQFASSIATDLLVIVITWARTYKLRSLAAKANIKASLSSLLLRDGKQQYCATHWLQFNFELLRYSVLQVVSSAFHFCNNLADA